MVVQPGSTGSTAAILRVSGLNRPTLTVESDSDGSRVQIRSRRGVSTRAAQFVAAVFTAVAMSGAMSAAMLALAFHGQPGWVVRWLRSWPIAFAVAYPLGAVLMPVAGWIRTRLEDTQATKAESAD